MDYILFQFWIKLQVFEINRCLIWYFNLYFKYLQQNSDGFFNVIINNKLDGN